jgi:type IV secretory pathway TrbD component
LRSSSRNPPTARSPAPPAEPASAPSNTSRSGEDNPLALAAQCSWGCLLRRCLIRHSDLVVGIVCFSCSLQAPTGLGLVLAAGSLITALQHGFANRSTAMAATRRCHRRSSQSGSADSTLSGGAPVRTSARQRQHVTFRREDSASVPAMSPAEQAVAFRAECAASDRSLGALTGAIIAVLQLVAAAWLLAQYLLQVRSACQASCILFPCMRSWPVLECHPYSTCCALS